MDYSLYFIIRQILMSLLLFMGLHMIFISLPSRMQGRAYKRSLRIMGIAFLIVPLSCLLYTRVTRFDLDPIIAPAISLSAYFATFLLMAMAFLTLLGRVFSKTIWALSLSAIFVFPIPLWASIISKNPVLIDTVKTSAYSFYVMIVILVVITILHRYYKIMENIDNYYAEDVGVCVLWISKSIKLLIGLAITCAIAPMFFSCAYYLRLIFMLYGVFCYIYIHYGYRSMLVNLTERFIEVNIREFVSDTQYDERCKLIKVEVSDNIQRAMDSWVAEDGFTQRGITINDVARLIKTNRTYLSKYINTTYDCSFKSWISHLRVERAKELMVNNPTLSINSVAEAIGFASVESFTHIFSRIEGVAPTKWRQANIKLDKNLSAQKS